MATAQREPLLTRGGADRLGTALLLLATLACLLLVPSPFGHLDEPAYWGVLGFFATLPLLLWARLTARSPTRGPAATLSEIRLLIVFLVAMPIIYLACRLRDGHGAGTLVLEIVGGLVYWTIAWRAVRHPVPLLAAGIALHGLWDLAHYGRTAYVPDWYALLCFVVDLGMGAYALGRSAAWRRTDATARPSV